MTTLAKNSFLQGEGGCFLSLAVNVSSCSANSVQADHPCTSTGLQFFPGGKGVGFFKGEMTDLKVEATLE